MSEIENVGLTWMASNTFKCNCLTPLHFKGLTLGIYLQGYGNAALRRDGSNG